jgi:hypothetical protein
MTMHPLSQVTHGFRRPDAPLFRHHRAGSTDSGALESGKERLAVEFGLERDRGRRFAMWALMHILGNAPDLDGVQGPGGSGHRARFHGHAGAGERRNGS